MESETKEVIELDYPAISVGKNIVTRVFDLFVTLVLGFLLVFPSCFLAEKLPPFVNAQNRVEEVKVDSGLYVEEDGYLIYLTDSFSSELTLDEKSEQLDTALAYFFGAYLDEELSGEGFDKYTSLLREHKAENGEELFDSVGNRIKTNDDYDQAYYDIYSSIFSEQALGYLSLKKDYLKSRKTMLALYLTFSALAFILSFCVFNLIIPLCFSRGKRTLGMLVTKTALLDVRGLSCPNKRFLLRFLFQLFVI